VFRRDAAGSLASEGVWLDVKDVGMGKACRSPVEQNRDPATNADRSAIRQPTSSCHRTTQDGGPTIQQPAADFAAPFVFRAYISISWNR
jgi:hypothetical protein